MQPVTLPRMPNGRPRVIGSTCAGSSSNDSNNTSKETRSSGGSGGDRSASGRFTDDTVRPRRSTTSTEAVDAAAAAAGDTAPGSPAGSVEDEWSRQLDELDRLRPPTGGAIGQVMYDDEVDGRLVVDSFTDLPDVVIDDVDDDAASVHRQTAADQVASQHVHHVIFHVASAYDMQSDLFF